jgi:transposase
MHAQRCYELSDFEWSIIEPLLPNKPRGVQRADDRKVLNGIYWHLRTGLPWADIPECYGPATTATIASFGGANLGCGIGVSKRCRRPTMATCRWSSLRRFACISTPPTSKGGPDEAQLAAGSVAASRCMGRSRGGLTTKTHALVDASGLPIRLKLTEGQAHDGRSAPIWSRRLKPGKSCDGEAATTTNLSDSIVGAACHPAGAPADYAVL